MRQRENKEHAKKVEKLDRYSITYTYIKGGDTSKQSAIGYRDMRASRSQSWKSTRKYHGRAYRVETVNTTRGKVVS